MIENKLKFLNIVKFQKYDLGRGKRGTALDIKEKRSYILIIRPLQIGLC
jgi:hypothetical protein